MKKKVFIIVFLLLIECTSVFLMNKSFSSSKKLDDVMVLKESDLGSDKLAIFLKDDGTYYKSTSKTFPTTDYAFNSSKSKCVNDDGDEIENILTYTDGSVSIRTNQIVSCSLYFDSTVVTPGGGDSGNSNILYNLLQSNAQDTTINYAVNSGTSGTNGIYTTNNTQNGSNVYFYRGVVNNNIIFGGFCWKIVRTTVTNGVKLIYNGVPTNGTCDNTGTSSYTELSKYNSNNGANAYVGYMYGATSSTLARTYTSTHANLNTSTIKTAVENWYSNNLSSYTSYLEDTIYCNDRNVVSGSSSSLGSSYGTNGYGTTQTAYAASARSSAYATNFNPSLVCNNTKGTSTNLDSFTVSSDLGNGKLNYPVGLLTLDEAVLAGYNNATDSSPNYLYIGTEFWTMTPVYFYSTAYVGTVNNSVSTGGVYSSYAIRPVVSLKEGTKITSAGTGTVSNPYVVDMS